MSRQSRPFAPRQRVHQRHWALWSLHFVVYLIYLYAQVTVLDSALGAVSRLGASVWLLLVLLHALLITGIDLRAQTPHPDNGMK